MPKLSIKHGNSGRSLHATADIESGSEILSIPSSLLISVRSDVYADPPELQNIKFQEDSYFWERASWEVRLAVVLLDHVRANDTSPWAPYIRTLPKQPGSILVALADKRRVDVAREQLVHLNLIDIADSYSAHIISQHAAFCDTLDEQTEPIGLAQFCWAVAVAQSRAFGVPPVNRDVGEPTEFALFPALDCGNHSSRVRSELRYNEEKDVFGVSIGNHRVDEGNECFLNYGYRSPAQLALFYGFVECGTPAASLKVGVEIVWEMRKDGDRLGERKQAVLDKADLAHDDDEFTVSLHEVDPRLMQSIRVCVADEAELDRLEEMDVLTDEPLSLANEIRAWDSLMHHLKWRKSHVGKEFEQEFAEMLALDRPFSVACDWGTERNDKAIALFKWERNRVVDTTISRVKQFRDMSERLGRLIDPAILKRAAGSVFRKPRNTPLGGSVRVL